MLENHTPLERNVIVVLDCQVNGSGSSFASPSPLRRIACYTCHIMAGNIPLCPVKFFGHSPVRHHYSPPTPSIHKASSAPHLSPLLPLSGPTFSTSSYNATQFSILKISVSIFGRFRLSVHLRQSKQIFDLAQKYSSKCSRTGQMLPHMDLLRHESPFSLSLRCRPAIPTLDTTIL